MYIFTIQLISTINIHKHEEFSISVSAFIIKNENCEMCLLVFGKLT